MVCACHVQRGFPTQRGLLTGGNDAVRGGWQL
jgi:hypothetical protein